MHIILEDPAKELPRWPKVIHESEDGLEANGHFKLLAPEDFTLLRKIRTATFEGLPLAYTTYLESTITGNSPLDHLSKMCEPLAAYAECYCGLGLGVSRYLERARKPMNTTIPNVSTMSEQR